ncbi:hemerythrin domain-containing protein [Actinomadura sp. WMMB 499]|uniref:hemerythrin domain-containing protein n=1 Tax=Actinomadura sp. WMMB 499 TaxID=1219491 RepID=UPI00124655CB|nr:hemerythrin domain-containing protein [Actinomadura sp. WMMB 499]QFG24590.1 hemerythrin domain-containing protein [Actinomadura sp. WMMB 499]
MANVFEVLGRDHDRVKEALAELEAGAGRTAPDELAHRRKLIERLVMDESVHEAVEEEYFWPVVRRTALGGDRLADHAVRQEQSAKYVMSDLIGMEPGDERFEELLRTFIADAREHIAFEEDVVWPELYELIGKEHADDLGRKIAEGRKRAPTRPHPHTPPRPGILKAAGPAMAVADRLRDRVAHRG